MNAINLHVTQTGDALHVVEVDNADYLDLCCEPANVQGKKTRPDQEVRYVADRAIDRQEVRLAVGEYLNRLREGRGGDGVPISTL